MTSPFRKMDEDATRAPWVDEGMGCVSAPHNAIVLDDLSIIAPDLRTIVALRNALPEIAALDDAVDALVANYSRLTQWNEGTCADVDVVRKAHAALRRKAGA